MLGQVVGVSGQTVINVGKPSAGKDMTPAIQKAVEKAARLKGKGPVVIKFAPGVYNISREKATARLQLISNTTTETENPNPVKHYGLYLNNLSDVTIDGSGATLLTHGEMTSMAVDSCRNIVIKNLTIDAADPSVVEMKVTARTDSTLTCSLITANTYSISPEGKISWRGEGWEFTGGIAQKYDGTYTLRCESPTDRYTSARAEGESLVFSYPAGKAPKCEVGEVYQMRHSFRTEVASFINCSENVTLSNVTYNFLGNFGIVGQMTRDITLDHVTCAPNGKDGRTCAGFADFVQMSGCSGLVKITGCDFAGAHDDPINVHGTHLKVKSVENPKTITVRYMHGQTRGFAPYNVGDEVALASPHTLLREMPAVVTSVERINDFEYRVGLDRNVDAKIKEMGDVVIENVTATPDVEIIGCRFTLTPTRGLLLSTSGRAVIKDNTFLNIPMSSILIADDGRSWFESGPVRDVTIENNRFIDCASPVINISPEISRYAGAVHSGIKILNNQFLFSDKSAKPVLVEAKAVDGLTLKGNTTDCPEANPLKATYCSNITTD